MSKASKLVLMLFMGLLFAVPFFWRLKLITAAPLR